MKKIGEIQVDLELDVFKNTSAGCFGCIADDNTPLCDALNELNACTAFGENKESVIFKIKENE